MVKALRLRSGQILVLNAGAWTGVYNKEPVVAIPPVNIELPIFTAPIPAYVGDVANIHQGVWSPLDTVVTIQIGYGTNINNFVPVFTANTGTLTPAFQGQRLSAVVFGTSGGINSSPIFVDSGITISAQVATWPPDISGSDWDAFEVRDSSPEGRRRITVSGSVTIPSGFELLLYSGLENGGLPTDAAARMTPGTTFTTVGTLPISSTAYNSLAWRNTTTNSIRRAHGPRSDLSANQQKIFLMQGLVITPPPPGGLQLSPDVLVSSTAAVRNQCIAWINNWNGTIPSGKTASSDRVIGLNATTSGVLDLSGLVNNNATTTNGRIIVRHVGSYSNYACSVRHNGSVNGVNARGIWLARMWIIGNTERNVNWSTSTNCGMDRVLCAQQDWSGLDFATRGGGAFYHVSLDNSTNFRMHHCLVQGGGNTNVSVNGPLGCEIVGCLTDVVTHDDYKASGWLRSFSLIRCWRGRRHWQSAAGDPHEDFFQNEANSYPMDGATFWGNVELPSDGNWRSGPGPFYPIPSPPYPASGATNLAPDPGTSWWYGGAPTPWAIQGLFFHQTSGSNWRFQQNIHFNNNTGIYSASFAPSDGIGICTDNMHVITGIRQSKTSFQGPFPTSARNFAAQGTTIAVNVANQGQGVDGIQVGVGQSETPARAGTSTRPASAYVPSSRNFSLLTNYFEHGIPCQNQQGHLKAANNISVRDFYPKIGTRLHWNFGGTTCGPTIRMREIFDRSYRESQAATVGYALIPGDVGWPVAKTWDDTYNCHGFVDTKIRRTAVYNADGDLVE